MENQKKTDEEIWDDLLNSPDGELALQHLLMEADLEIATDKVSPLFDEPSFNENKKQKLKG